MRYALISDIHGNLPALDAVLQEIQGRTDVDAIFHLGDLVGYAPWPDGVVERIRELGILGVAGNYDSTIGTAYDHCGCRYEDPRQEALAHESYAWTLSNTTSRTRGWLAALPFRMDLRPRGGHTPGPRLFLIHGNAILNTVYWTEDRSDAFAGKMIASLGAKSGDVIAFGHTHYPWSRVVEGVRLVNCGSVGRPKDGDPRAGYARVEFPTSEAPRWEHIRVDYPVEEAAAAIRGSTLPDDFAHYLETGGRLPSRGPDPEGKQRDN